MPIPHHLVPVVKGTVWGRHAARFNLCGQKLPTQLYQTEEEIPRGLAVRLWRYARECMIENDLEFCTNWQAEVETIDTDLPSSDRCYSVWWESPQGMKIGVQGIHISRYGWPILHHGMFIDPA